MENDASIHPIYASCCETVSFLILKISGTMFSRHFKNKYEDTYWKEASEGNPEKQIFTDGLEIMVWKLFKDTILKNQKGLRRLLQRRKYLK